MQHLLPSISWRITIKPIHYLERISGRKTNVPSTTSEVQLLEKNHSKKDWFIQGFIPPALQKKRSRQTRCGLMETTYWGRYFGVMLFKDAISKCNICIRYWWLPFNAIKMYLNPVTDWLRLSLQYFTLQVKYWGLKC